MSTTPRSWQKGLPIWARSIWSKASSITPKNSFKKRTACGPRLLAPITLTTLRANSTLQSCIERRETERKPSSFTSPLQRSLISNWYVADFRSKVFSDFCFFVTGEQPSRDNLSDKGVWGLQERYQQLPGPLDIPTVAWWHCSRLAHPLCHEEVKCLSLSLNKWLPCKGNQKYFLSHSFVRVMCTQSGKGWEGGSYSSSESDEK